MGIALLFFSFFMNEIMPGKYFSKPGFKRVELQIFLEGPRDLSTNSVSLLPEFCSTDYENKKM
jgi:hypothetical protein